MTNKLLSLPWVDSSKPIKVAIVGDVILDEYLDGLVGRISPEAPVPVHLVKERKLTAGGAANDARNVKKAGGECILFSICGSDEAYKQLKDILSKDGIDSSGLISVTDRPTVKKTRITSNNQQLLRVDWEKVHPITIEQQNSLFDKIESSDFDALLISDYAKGTLPKVFLQKLIGLSRE